MSRPFLSAALIVKNEEKFLPRCLESLRGVVDQITVVDTGSTDGTIQIAKSFGAEVSHFDWTDDFSAARNRSIWWSDGEWVLIIDADEHLEGALCVPGKLEEFLREYSESHAHQYWPQLFVKVPVIDRDVHETMSAGLTKQLRIFPNDPRIFYESPIHNRLALAPELKSRTGLAFEVPRAELRIIHRGYDPSVQRDKRKSERAFRILRRAIEERPDALNHFYLGREHHHQEEWEEAILHLKQAKDLLLASNSVLEQHHLEGVYFYYVSALNKAKIPLEDIRSELVEALERFPENPDLWHEAGTIFLEHEEYESAKDAFLRAEETLPCAEEREASFLIYRVWVLYFNLARTLGMLGDVAGARVALQKAVDSGCPVSGVLEDLIEPCPVVGFVRAGVASVPARRDHLEQVIATLLPQVDAITVYLNNYPDKPEFLRHPKINVWLSQFTAGDLRDSGKFYGLPARDWDYFFAVDDDLLYPPNYVATLVTAIERHERRAVVGVHGSRLLPELASYVRDRQVFHCLEALETEEPVDVIGTGTLAFHRSTLQLSIGDFERHGMADLYFSLAAATQRVPRIVVPRRRGWLTLLEVTTGTLWEEAVQDDHRQTDLARRLQAPAG